MKKKFGIYSVIWAICLAIFNVITFVTPNEINGVSKFTSSFWVGYIYITVAFICQLLCALAILKAKKRNSSFYNFSLFFISYSGVIAMLISGGIFMANPTLPVWIGVIICAVILAVNAICVILTKTVADNACEIDEKNKSQIYFMKKLSAEAKALMAVASSDELCAEAKRVYEAIRYSNPKSSSLLADLNLQIEREFYEFSNAVKDADTELAQANASALIELLEKRNNTAKLIKND